MTGFEMLARWTHPVHGPVPPSVFVAAAEDSDLIADIAAGLLRRACRAAAGWPASLSVSVNVSPLQLRDRTLVPVVQAALAESGLAPTRLELELTEGAVVGDLDLAREVLAELDSLGVRIALDDFGTGYSSLQHLTALPISRLKIDAGFVRGMTTDSESRKIVAAVLGLGQSFGLPTVAEGIEDEASALALEAMGCDTGQGWLFGQALPAAEATALALSGRLGHGGASVPGSGLSRIDLDRV